MSWTLLIFHCTEAGLGAPSRINEDWAVPVGPIIPLYGEPADNARAGMADAPGPLPWNVPNIRAPGTDQTVSEARSGRIKMIELLSSFPDNI